MRSGIIASNAEKGCSTSSVVSGSSSNGPQFLNAAVSGVVGFLAAALFLCGGSVVLARRVELLWLAAAAVAGFLIVANTVH